MTSDRCNGSWAVVGLMLACCSAAHAQVALSNVTGVVTDSQDLAVPGAQVAILNTGTGIENAAETNESGYYTLVSLNPGDYELTVEAEGFRRNVRQDIRLETGQQLRLDIALEIGTVTESVTVSSGAPAINLAATEPSRAT